MLKSYRKAFLDTLLPPICLSCKSEGFYICETCFETLRKRSFFVCPVCKKRNVGGKLDAPCRKESGLSRFLGSPLLYSDEAVQKIIHALKYAHAKDLTLPLSEILIQFLLKNNFADIIQRCKPKIILLPVPLYNYRERERGFNQAGEIAEQISARFKLELDRSSLKKSKNTAPQAEIKTKEERLQNLSGAFSMRNPEKIRGKIILLADDVYTSGATMKECSLTLRSAGAKEIWGVSVAR